MIVGYGYIAYANMLLRVVISGMRKLKGMKTGIFSMPCTVQHHMSKRIGSNSNFCSAWLRSRNSDMPSASRT